MKYILLSLSLFITTMSYAQYKVGDTASDFNLLNVDDSMFSMSDDADARGYIVIFTCNHCPYSKLYEQRIIELDNEFRSQGFPVVAINSNDPQRVPEDSYPEMKKRAEEKAYPFPYLFDETQEIAREYGATRTPHVFVLEKHKGKLKVRYIGAIDDNARSAESAEALYVSDAVKALLSGEKVSPDFTKAIGCTIKWAS